MARSLIPWIAGGVAAAAGLYFAIRPSEDPIGAPPDIDPEWIEKYRLAEVVLSSQNPTETFQDLAPGQKDLFVPGGLIIKDAIQGGLAIDMSPEAIRRRQEKMAQQATFYQRWGIVKEIKASQLIRMIDQDPSMVSRLFQFPMSDDQAHAPGVSAYDAGRVTILLDTVDSVQYFSGVLLLALLASFDPATGKTVNLDKPVVINTLRLFSYHDWVVDEPLATWQVETLNRFVCAPTRRWMRNPDGSTNEPLRVRDESGKLVFNPEFKHSTTEYATQSDLYLGNTREPGYNIGVTRVPCTPDHYPSMRTGGAPPCEKTPSPVDGKYFEDDPSFPGGLFKLQRKVGQVTTPMGILNDNLGPGRQRAMDVMREGRLWLFEYASLRLQNIAYLSTMIGRLRDYTKDAIEAGANAVKGIINLAAGNPQGILQLLQALGQVLMMIFNRVGQQIKADEDSRLLQKNIERHLNTLLLRFWRVPPTDQYLSGYQLGVIYQPEDGKLWQGYKYGAGNARSESFLMRNFALMHDGNPGEFTGDFKNLFTGPCAYQIFPQIPLFYRAVPFATIVGAQADWLIAVEPVYGYIVPPNLRAAWEVNPPRNLRVPLDAKGPVGYRILFIHRQDALVHVAFGPGQGVAPVPVKQYVGMDGRGGLGLPTNIRGRGVVG